MWSISQLCSVAKGTHYYYYYYYTDRDAIIIIIIITRIVTHVKSFTSEES